MSRIRKICIALVCCLAAIALAPAGTASATTWILVGCANTSYSGAKICFYYASGLQMQGRFINGSSQNITNQGQFAVSAGPGSAQLCGVATTAAYTTSICTKTALSGVTYYLDDRYHINGTSYDQFVNTASHKF